MRTYYFFMKFWNSFCVGFRCGLIFLFCIGAILFAIYLVGFPLG